MTRYLGVDLAWGSLRPPDRETGLVHLDTAGSVLDAGWAVGVDAVEAWIVQRMHPGDVIAIDASLVVTNATGQRLAETQVGQRYGRWKVSANSTNLGSTASAGVALRRRLEARGVAYDDGSRPLQGTRMFECYPYTTLVGAPELGYDTERPRYKRKPRAVPTASWRPERARVCDDLIARLATVVDLASHPVTASLLTPSPLIDRAYKHREDLIDAVLCAWTASLWDRFGRERCQVLGEAAEADAQGRHPVIIAPARAEQRR